MNGQLKSILADIATNLEERMENIQAIKGEAFAQAVMLACNQYTIMRIGISDMPSDFRKHLMDDMCAMQTIRTAKALGLSKEDCKEMVELAMSITEQISEQGQRLAPLIDKELGEG